MMISGAQFAILRLLCKSYSMSTSNLVTVLNADPLLQATAMMHYSINRHHRQVSSVIH